MFRVIKVAALVEEIGGLAHYAKAMCKPRRNEHLVMIVVVQFGADPATKCRRIPSQIDRYVEDPTGERLHQLGLRMLNLNMQPSQRPMSGPGDVVLHELGADP